MERRCACPHGVLFEVTVWLVFTAGITTSLPVQTINEIFRNVDTEDSLLRADLETLYTLTHKSWSPHVIDNEVTSGLAQDDRDPREYVVETETENNNQTNSTASAEAGVKKDVDPWSLIWYMASFGGLVAFFLVVSCSECCCSKRTSAPSNTTSNRPVEPPPEVSQWVDETPPPPYHLFAPPSYDTLFYAGVSDEKNKCEVFVVPIHSHMVSLQSTASDATVTPT